MTSRRELEAAVWAFLPKLKLASMMERTPSTKCLQPGLKLSPDHGTLASGTVSRQSKRLLVQPYVKHNGGTAAAEAPIFRASVTLCKLSRTRAIILQDSLASHK
ncbi:hypothetical protein DL546_000712 [Coniochaeta pulveracea]|uniref:Uncharacterized protein n=1 Tax=Coniochaeta pulveracea TaxID=177199 RepID=A0A420XX54_9PEZI|nr:hypothetical protein DL546_000712 [Coniochaeta pulveracea]